MASFFHLREREAVLDLISDEHNQRGFYFVAAKSASESRVLEGKFENSFREMPKALKFLKTAKSNNFWTQGYQRLSKTHDFAGETISFRFRFTWASFSFRAKSWEAAGGGDGQGSIT
jgi:hypothetical protein